MNCVEVGKKYLITTDWFIAPDGETYRAVFGTLRGVFSSEETLGVRTNAKSTNWYVSIGRMTVAGCQIHYVVQADEVSTKPPMMEAMHEGKSVGSIAPMTRIFLAD